MQVTGPLGGVTRLTWEGNLLTGMTDPEGVRLTLDYDAHGDVVAITNAAEDVYRLVRDEAGRVAEAVTPSGAASRFACDLDLLHTWRGLSTH